VTAGSKAFLDSAVILEDQRPLVAYCVDMSPAVNNAEWDLRAALNCYLLGMCRSDFERQQEQFIETQWHLGPWPRNKSLRVDWLARRIEAYDHVVSDADAALVRFQVRYVALPVEQNPPQYLDKDWTLIENGLYWQIWERNGNMRRQPLKVSSVDSPAREEIDEEE
jgi:hypothetical protein